MTPHRASDTAAFHCTSERGFYGNRRRIHCTLERGFLRAHCTSKAWILRNCGIAPIAPSVKSTRSGPRNQIKMRVSKLWQGAMGRVARKRSAEERRRKTATGLSPSDGKHAWLGHAHTGKHHRRCWQPRSCSTHVVSVSLSHLRLCLAFRPEQVAARRRRHDPGGGAARALQLPARHPDGGGHGRVVYGPACEAIWNDTLFVWIQSSHAFTEP